MHYVQYIKGLLFSSIYVLISYNLQRGGGDKVPALISNIRVFATTVATATKFGDFS